MEEPEYLACPSCKSDEGLASIEALVGTARGRFTEDRDDIEWEGSTDVDWNSSTPIGIVCDCGWDYYGPDHLDKLVPAEAKTNEA